MNTAPSLHRRLLLALLGPLLLLFALGGAASYSLSRYFADAIYDGWLYDSVSSLALEVNRRGLRPSVELPASTLRLFEWDVADKTFFQIMSPQAGAIAGRRDLPPVPEDAESYRDALMFDALVDGQRVRVAALELPAEGLQSQVWVKVAETLTKRRALSREILLATLIPQMLLIGVAALAIRGGVLRGLRPLGALARRLQVQGTRQVEPIPDPGVPQEVLPLTHALNDLLSRLAASMNAQRRFVADAAHQLRTPLTALKLQVEEAGREPDLERTRLTLAALRESTDRAVRLSNQLLSLARAEPDAVASLPRQRFDLRALVQAIGAEWVPRALKRGIEMEFDDAPGAPPLWVRGDAPLLREALANLIDNALTYHQPPGTLRLSLRTLPEVAVIVEDDGPGIAAALRPQMLARFARGERGGSGLGLPIASEIAQAHGGGLRLLDGANGHGLRVELSLGPAARVTG